MRENVKTGEIIQILSEPVHQKFKKKKSEIKRKQEESKAEERCWERLIRSEKIVEIKLRR